jgi:hypothetical protein
MHAHRTQLNARTNHTPSRDYERKCEPVSRSQVPSNQKAFNQWAAQQFRKHGANQPIFGNIPAERCGKDGL